MDDVLSLGAAEIARQIRAGQRSVSDVLEAHIRRIEAVNPALNALVTPNFEAARAAAQAADTHLAQHGPADLPPLFGVPITIKDAFPVAGLRFTAGAWALRDHVADADAEAVSRLKAAGAIVLGKTNCPELSWLIETVNPVFGRTNNPHDPARTVGGSSGGEAALIAAGGSPLGLGSDIAGSVRVPAAACGVVSLKPTAGRIPTAGHVPDFGPALPGWNTAGPMARRVEDLALALGVLSETPVVDYTTIDLSGRRVLSTLFPATRIAPGGSLIAAAVAAATSALAAAGMVPAPGTGLPVVGTMLAYASLLVPVTYPVVRRALGGGPPYRLLEEVRAIRRGEGRIRPETLFFIASTERPCRLLPFLGYDAGRLERLRARWLALMGEGGLIVTNVLRGPAPRHGWSWRQGILPMNTPLFNALGFPAAVVPVGWTAGGLPLAVQIVARPGEDEVALAAAAVLERRFGGWRMALA